MGHLHGGTRNAVLDDGQLDDGLLDDGLLQDSAKAAARKQKRPTPREMPGQKVRPGMASSSTGCCRSLEALVRQEEAGETMVFRGSETGQNHDLRTYAPL